MSYIVVEIQNDSVMSTSYQDKETAFEKFFDVARYIPKSQLDCHTVIITNDKGLNLFPPITKDILK